MLITLLIHWVILYSVLPFICHHQQFQIYLIKAITSNFNLGYLCCSIHAKTVETKIVKCIIKLYINHWCTDISKILNVKRRIGIDEKDAIKLFANK